MTSLKLLKAINNIDDKYIEEAMPSVYKEEKKSFLNIKMLASVFCVLLLGVVGINVVKVANNNAKSTDTAYETTSESVSDDSVMITNPYMDVDSLYEAQELVGFTFNTPDLDYDKSFVVVDSYILEVNYLENDNTIFTLRKAKGNEDISGVYPIYEGLEERTIDNISTTIYSGADGVLIRLVKDGYFYSVFSEDLNNKDQAIEIATYIIESN